MDHLPQVIAGDCIEKMREMPDQSVQCCVTSPPYFGLRDYGVEGQIGLEDSPEEFVDRLVVVFREVRRLLRDDGTLWLNLGDSYNAYNANRGASTGFSDGSSGRGHPSHPRGLVAKSLKNKDLIGIPWRVALALQTDGWYLRQDIIWHKPNPMPESITDRCTKAHEYVFLLSKSPRYHFDADAIREPHQSAYSIDAIGKNGGIGGSRPTGDNFSKENRRVDGRETPSTRADRARLLHPLGRNKRDVWTIPTKPFKGAHFAVFPEELVEPCLLAGCPEGGVVLDPFAGSGTVGAVARRLRRESVMIELNEKYAKRILSR